MRVRVLGLRDDAASEQELMATEHRDALLKEQQIWQRELQDASFRHAVTQTENQKLELRVRQLERDLAKRNDALVANETQRIAHLDAKVQQRYTRFFVRLVGQVAGALLALSRTHSSVCDSMATTDSDGEIAKLRRERNTLLGTLREHVRLSIVMDRLSLSLTCSYACGLVRYQERKLASLRPASTESMATQTELNMATLSAALDRPSTRSVGSQTAAGAPSTHRQHAQSTDMRMRLDEIAVPTTFTPGDDARPPAATPTMATQALSAQDEIARRLQQLQSLTASLLDDDD